jgi:hypothetical protein
MDDVQEIEVEISEELVYRKKVHICLAKEFTVFE